MIKEINNQLANCSLDRRESLMIDLLNKEDWTKQEVINESISYVKHIIDDRLMKNLDVSRIEAKCIFFMLAKTLLAREGLQDVSVKVLDKRKSNAGAFYVSEENTIYLLEPELCNQDEFCRIGRYKTTELNVNSRLDFFIHQLFSIEHEIQHANQFKNMRQTLEDSTALNPFLVEMQLQELVRLFYGVKGSEYEDVNAKLYDYSPENHDNFIIELDADVKAIDKLFEILELLSAQAYNLAKNEKRNSYVKWHTEKSKKLNNLDKLEWFVPCKNKIMNTRETTIAIISDVLPKLSSAQRLQFMEQYPALKLIYTESGQFRSDSEILNYKDSLKLKCSLRKDMREKFAQIEDLYSFIAKFFGKTDSAEEKQVT